MKKLRLFTLMAIACLGLSFAACSDDDDDTVGVDAALGIYSQSKIEYYFLNGADELVQIPNDVAQSYGLPLTDGNVLVSKEGNGLKILTGEEGDDEITGVKVAEASNGFTFNIESQTYEGMTIAGYNNAELGSTKYHGVFLSASKTIEIGMQISFDDFIAQAIEEEDEETFRKLILSDYEALVMCVTIK